MNKSHDDLPMFFPSFNGAAIFASAPCAPCGSGRRPAASPLRGGVAPAPLRSNAGRSAPPRGGRPGQYHGITRDIFPIYHGNLGNLPWEYHFVGTYFVGKLENILESILIGIEWE